MEARAGGSRGDPRSMAYESMRVLHYIPRNILVGCDQAGERLVDHKSIHMSSQVVPSVGQLHLS